MAAGKTVSLWASQAELDWIYSQLKEYQSQSAVIRAAFEIGMRVMKGETRVVPSGAPAEEPSPDLTPEEGQAILTQMNVYNGKLKLAMSLIDSVEVDVKRQVAARVKVLLSNAAEALTEE